MRRNTLSIKRLLHRLRHRKGHGIHPPFAFWMVTHIIEEKHPYYCFPVIKRLYQQAPRQLKLKEVYLLLRLTVMLEAKRVLVVGADHAFLAQSFKELIPTLEVEHAREMTLIERVPFDLIYVQEHGIKLTEGKQIIQNLVNALSFKSTLVLSRIHKDLSQRQLWRDLIARQELTLSLDLFDLGIIRKDSGLQKQRFCVAF